MSAAQLFIGSLSRETQERDLENVFFKHGKLLRCDLKRGFGFVEYESPRDAEEAIREEDGRRLLGSRIVVEWAKGSVGDRTGRLRDRSRSRDRDRDRDFGGRSRRSGPGGGRFGGYDRERSPRYSNYNDSYRDRRRSISPPRGRSFRDDRYDDRRDRDRFGGGGRLDRGFDRDSRYDRDRFSRRY